MPALKPLQNAHVLNVHSAFSSVLPCPIASHSLSIMI